MIFGARPSDGSSTSRSRGPRHHARGRRPASAARRRKAGRRDSETFAQAREMTASSRSMSLRCRRPVAVACSCRSRRFSATVRVANMCRPSGTSETPRRAICSGTLPAMLAPSRRICPPEPASRRRRPPQAWSTCPAPLGPMMQTISPSLDASETPFKRVQVAVTDDGFVDFEKGRHHASMPR